MPVRGHHGRMNVDGPGIAHRNLRNVETFRNAYAANGTPIRDRLARPGGHGRARVGYVERRCWAWVPGRWWTEIRACRRRHGKRENGRMQEETDQNSTPAARWCSIRLEQCAQHRTSPVGPHRRRWDTARHGA